MSSCCTPVDYDPTVCPNPCTTATLDCSDLLTILIQAILDLAEPNGSSNTSIFERSQVICPDTTITQSDIDTAIATAAKRGILYRRIATSGADPTFLVNGRMAELNVQNKRYNRLPCQYNSFYTT